MKLYQFEQIDPDHKSSQVTIDAAWQRAVADAVDPQNPVQAAALHYATVTGVVPLRVDPGKKSGGARPGLFGRVPIPEPAVVVEEIARMGPESNIAIRPPVGIIGLDVDTYPIDGGLPKRGHDHLIKFTEQLGQLDPTWHSSRRPQDPAIANATFWYRLPTAVLNRFATRGSYPNLYDKLGRNVMDVGVGVADIEVIDFIHRYLIVAPSIADGLAYQWYRPDNTTEPGLLPPDFACLPVLPRRWVYALVKNLRSAKSKTLRTGRTPGETYTSGTATGRDDAAQAQQWCADHVAGWNDPPDAWLADRVDAYVLDLKTMSKGRYDTLGRAYDHLVRAAAGGGPDGYYGHPGGQYAIDAVTTAYLAAMKGDDNEDKALNNAARRFAWTADIIAQKIASGELNPQPQTTFRFAHK